MEQSEQGATRLEGEKHRILFVCKQNSCRSQMAEALARAVVQELGLGERVSVASAGLASTEVDGTALEVLGESGIDTRGLFSKALGSGAFVPAEYTCVVSLCGCASLLPPEWRARPCADWRVADPKGRPIADFRIARDTLHGLVCDLLSAVRDNNVPAHLARYAPDEDAPCSR
eukprot:TRINITY_DN18719_c0_g1_i1.p1 TRINITY_DN18719_c0_g1~~TRINITY_DN18719_c0_g1_i1.p1  ORF type:complete len:173 (+),score=16.08 TRINITY_DN18719_c0_g1_i1:67-585(+)